MKIKRFFAADIRQAMRMVKEELGADAVIMSNRTVDGGIEIVAAQDFDEQSIHNKLQEQTPEQQKPPAYKAKKIVLPNFDAAKKRLQLLNSQRKQSTAAVVPEQPVHKHIDQYVGYAEKIQLREQPETTTLKLNASVLKEDLLKNVKPSEKQTSLSDKLLMEMSNELKYLRTAMDTKLANISWAYNSQTTPVRTDLLQRLAGMSISKKLSVMIANHFTSHTDPELVFTKAQEMLVKVLPIAEDKLLETGGIVALVGPTGVGKTTTIAKLATKFVLKHGSNQVALITTDNYRIGAHEQLNTYGRILDVPVRVASSAQELRNLINGFADKRLVLIDTAGMSQRDMKLVEQINTLRENGLSIRSYLVMSAATEYKAMNAIIKAFAIFDPQASILTKLDEAVTIGSAISSIIEHNLPLSFITDGQQVPEDIHSAHARSLIEHCVAELSAESDFNDSVDYEPWMVQGYA
ncbi:MAG: flagellar biosynthesis protein FlhF [Methylobacter sp.]